MTEVLSKSEFATRRGVSPAAVSQWISSGRLSGTALIGVGRTARIDVAEAERQLAMTLDPGQQMARGGRPVASALPPAGAADLPASNAVARYQEARAVSAEIEAERQRRRQEEERGLYMQTAAARDAWSKELAALVQALDGWLPDLAQELAAAAAAGEPMDAKALTVRLRNAWRAFRAKRSTLAASARDAEPALVAPVEG